MNIINITIHHHPRDRRMKQTQLQRAFEQAKRDFAKDVRYGFYDWTKDYFDY